MPRAAAKPNSKYCHRCGAALGASIPHSGKGIVSTPHAASAEDEPFNDHDVLMQLEAELASTVAISEKATNDDVQIEGFRARGNTFRESSFCGEEDWDLLRAKFAEHARAELDAKEDMKDETESSASEENISAMGTVKIARTAMVFNLQQSCSTSFRDGHALHSLGAATSVSDERSERARGCGRDLSDTSSAFVFHRASGCDGIVPQNAGLCACP